MTSLNSNDPRSLDSGRETLRNAGYQEGDVVSSWTRLLTDNFSTSSGTFAQPGTSGGETELDFDSVPTSATLLVRMTFETGATVDADGDYRLRLDAREGGAVATTPITTVSSGSTFSRFTTDTVEVDLRERATARPSLRSDGANTISMFRATLETQIQL